MPRSIANWSRRAVADLQAERIYLPFESGPYRMAMGLFSVPEDEWFELDERYISEMSARRRLLATHHADVFAALPQSDDARGETLAEMARSLAANRPQWFALEGPLLHNRLAGETWDRSSLPCDPLELAGRLVQEDLCIVQNTDAGPLLTAAVLCFPSRWRLTEKIGRPLAEVHARVPLYSERLARPVDGFMRHLKPGHIAGRLNWSVLDDAALFQASGKWRQEHNRVVTGENAGETLFLRVERQTLRRLPRTGAVLFGIRVHVYRLGVAITTPVTAACLAEAIRALPESTSLYKSIPSIRAALLDWLDRRAD
jgi:dimethylamine monooxygenase subunit A